MWFCYLTRVFVFSISQTLVGSALLKPCGFENGYIQEAVSGGPPSVFSFRNIFLFGINKLMLKKSQEYMLSYTLIEVYFYARSGMEN